jgi:phage tail-like protein
MDANGLRHWMLAGRGDWELTDDPATLHYDSRRRVLRLASQSAPPAIPEPALAAVRTEALARLERVPMAIDAFRTYAFWDQAAGVVMAAGAAAGAVPILAPPVGSVPSDLVCGHDGVFYCAVDGSIVLQDRRGRWAAVSVASPEVVAWRMAADPAGGVWVLDRTSGRLGRLHGKPLRQRPEPFGQEEDFDPCEPNPDPPRIDLMAEAGWPGDQRPVALACSQEGRIAVLTWDAIGTTRIYDFLGHGRYTPDCTLLGARFPYTMSWSGRDRVALATVALATEALVYEVDPPASSVDPQGEFHPLFHHDGGPFLHTVDYPARYPTTVDGRSSPLHPLSMPDYARSGIATNHQPAWTGGAEAGTTWHRIYLEASIPANCSIRVCLAAVDKLSGPSTALEWHEHHFGSTTAPSSPGIPTGVWVSYPSELPFHPGLLDCPSHPGTSGLFTALVQRSGRPVSTVRGRYLQVRVELMGDGWATPELAALRVYGSRFSYVDRYLPTLFREDLFGPDADRVQAQATPADFLERYLDNFEGVLTPLEDRIAASHMLTDPRTTYEESLGWLGSWLGVTFDPVYPPDRRRRLLEATPELYRRHGTIEGLRLALDIATEGACSRGEILILEDFRLRRTFATILGADLADEEDPLLAGIVRSGNSYVGDTLFLGDENRKEFLSVFTPVAELNAAETQVVNDFLERLAFRVTVLVHDQLHPHNLGLVQRIVDLETPAHVLSRVTPVTTSFLVSLASLVGVDTYLTEEPAPEPVRVGASQVGVRDRVLRPATLDPRLAGGLTPILPLESFRPQADAGEDLLVGENTPFTLDASRSSPAPGGTITRYVWMLLNP